jgi:lysozyme
MIHPAALELIKEFEDCHLKAYKCPANVFTVGYGTTRIGNRSVREGDVLFSEKEAEKILVEQLEREYLPKMKIIPGWDKMNANQQSALLSFAYNLGAHFYGSVGFETITKHLRLKDWDAIPRVLELYVKGGGKTLPGLVRRRKREGELWRTPVESTGTEGCLGLKEK